MKLNENANSFSDIGVGYGIAEILLQWRLTKQISAELTLHGIIQSQDGEKAIEMFEKTALFRHLYKTQASSSQIRGFA